jgi:hypothetical protein
MSDPGFVRSDFCSIRMADEQEELAQAVRGGVSAYGYPMDDDDPPAPLTSGIDRAIRLSTAAAVLAVAGIAAYVSYGHAYAVIRAHGETGITARLEPATIDGLVYASSMVVLYAAPGSGALSRPLAARAGHRGDPYGKHGPGLVPRSGRGGGRGLAGGQSRGLVRTSGLAHPHLRAGRPRAVGSAPLHWCGLPCCGASCPGLSHRRRTPRREPARHVRPGVAARGSGRRAVACAPPADNVTMRRVRPTLSMTRRWPRTGSACRPETRCRNAGSPRCSGTHPAAGHEPESPMHGRHRRSQTHRTP